MKVGDYIRTKNGISKVKEIHEVVTTDNEYITTLISTDHGTCGEENVIKYSQNIIDLIEVGDYVNGVLINIKDNKGVYHGAYDCADEVHITKFEDIKSIVTYEQFESMKYKVGKDNE